MNDTLTKLEQTIESRKGAPRESSYVAALHAKGLNSILKKICEEATETVLAAKDGVREEVIYEAADLLFHTMVLLSHQNIKFEEVLAELARREGTSGNAEKASRG